MKDHERIEMSNALRRKYNLGGGQERWQGLTAKHAVNERLESLQSRRRPSDLQGLLH